MSTTDAAVTVAALAAAKRLPAEVLASFGVRDAPEGHVVFEYRSPSGTTGRSRLRLGLRGAGGSAWPLEDQTPITAYGRPVAPGESRPDWTLLVEGESDCWVAWYHGLPCIGIPGSDNVGALTLSDLFGIDTVYLQEEADSSTTFPNGFTAYADRVVRHLDAVGFRGNVRLFRLDDLDDLSDLHLRQPEHEAFVHAVDQAVAAARDLRPST